MSPNDDYDGDVDVERLDIVTDAKIDAAVADARKAYFQKLVNDSCIFIHERLRESHNHATFWRNICTSVICSLNKKFLD